MEISDIFNSFLSDKSSFTDLERELRVLLNNQPTLTNAILQTFNSHDISQHLSSDQRDIILNIINEVSVQPTPESVDSEETLLSDKTQISQQNYSDLNDSTQISNHINTASSEERTVISAEIIQPAKDSDTQLATSTDAPNSNAANTSIETESSSHLQVGSILKERFVLENVLGQGGMGTVYKARDLRKEEAHDRNPYVAVKVLNESFKDHPQSLISLQREARKAQTLAHPNIVNVFDFDRDSDNVYMTMEYLEGDSLDRIIKRSYPDPLPKTDAFQIIDGICNGLGYAHSHNIIHSDLKPGNIFVTDTGAVKIFDFGIARAMKSADGSDKITGETTLFDAGSLGGLTPAYASYEMLVGDEPDIRDDIYALACISYELLGGKHPFNKLPANQAKKQNLSPAAINTIHRRQNKGLLLGLKFDRNARTPSVEQFQKDVVKEQKLGKPTIITISIAVIALTTVIAFPVKQYFTQHKNETLIAELKKSDPKIINKALSQLDNMDQKTRDTILNESRDSLIHYFEQKADAEIDPSKNKYNYKQAFKILKNAKRYYPDSAQLSSINSRIENSKNQLLNDLTKRFNALLDKGELLPRAGSDDIMDILAKVAQIDDKHPLLVDPRIPVAYAEQAQRAAQTHNYRQANALLNAGLGLFPKDATMLTIRDAINEAETSATPLASEKLAKLKLKAKSLSLPQKQQRIASLIDKPFSDRNWNNTLKSYIEDIKSSVNPKDPWLTKTSSTIAKLYITRADSMLAKNRFTEASRMTKLAKFYAPTLPDILSKEREIRKSRTEFQATLAKKAKFAKIEGLKQTLLTQAKANDVKAAKSNLQTLKKLLPASDKFIRSEAPNAIADAYYRLASDIGSRGSYKQAKQLIVAGLEVSPAMPKLEELLKKFKKAERATLNQDPCKTSFAGYGKRSKATCYDVIPGGEKGPAMVVIPAGSGFKHPYAIGKYEVSIKDFNIYCRLSGECKPITSRSPDLPVTGISIKQAIHYTQWLSKTTGYSYRLPNEKEWLYAANAQGSQPSKDFNCRVMLGDTLVKGNALLSIKTGRTNGWGLANYIGNAQEWVTSGKNSYSVRGGSYEDPLSNCDTSINRPTNGNPDKITGFRLFRKLKTSS